MALDPELERCLKKLRELLTKMIRESGEFAKLREMLGDQQLQVQFLLVPLIFSHGEPQGINLEAFLKSWGAAGSDELKFELTPEDEEFLKKYGLRF